MKIEAVDLFCGIGGLTYGLKKAKINVVAGLDNDESCQFAFEENNGAKFVAEDISKYDFKKMLGLFSEGSVRVLVGCAPCQPFSSHSYKTKNRDQDVRWNLIEYFVDAIDVLQPDVISMENVPGLMKTDVFKKFCSDLIKRDYDLDYKVVYCPDYGVPQARNRLVLLGSRLGKISVPNRTHKKYVTVADTIKSLEPIRAGQVNEQDSIHRSMGLLPINMKRIKKSKPGGSWKDWEKKLLPKCYRKASGQGYTPVYGRMSWKDVAPTITTQFFNYGSGRFGHPVQNRALSVREGALLQTFPRSYKFDSTQPTSKIGRHIGNAVPPRLGYVIGRRIASHVTQFHGKSGKAASI